MQKTKQINSLVTDLFTLNIHVEYGLSLSGNKRIFHIQFYFFIFIFLKELSLPELFMQI